MCLIKNRKKQKIKIRQERECEREAEINKFSSFSSTHTSRQIDYHFLPEIAASHWCVHLTVTNKRNTTAEQGGVDGNVQTHML